MRLRRIAAAFDPGSDSRGPAPSDLPAPSDPRALLRCSSLRALIPAAAAASLLFASASASAQEPPLSESIVIGSWTFRPSFEVRIRGEVRKNLVAYTDSGVAVLADGYHETPPVSFTSIPDSTIWGLSERSRLGMAVDRGPVTGVIVLQDARVLGGISGFGGSTATSALGGLAAGSYGLSMREAYVDVHSRSGRSMFLRVGRQKVVWGDGRLVGESDWSPAPRSLDAARFGVQIGDFDIEAMGALLTPPFTQTIPATSAADKYQTVSWTGAQLYGLNVKWHLLPLFNPEVTALSRIVRVPGDAGITGAGAPLTPGDTYVLDGRFSGDRRGFQYSVEGAYELGRVASYGVNRDLGAFAVAARASLETALPGHLTFGAQGAVASGDTIGTDPARKQTRFDPILPDAYANHGAMGLYAWSNLIEAGGDVKVTPIDELSVSAGYRFAAMAEPEGRWTTASLTAVGASNATESRIMGNDRVLGHEIDAGVTITPWDPIEIRAGYGLFLFGDKAKAILSAAGQNASMQHWGYLQMLVHAP